jgi:hypothetical protein
LGTGVALQQAFSADKITSTDMILGFHLQLQLQGTFENGQLHGKYQLR